MRLEFLPPAKPWSTNEDRNLNKYARAELIKLWKDATIVMARKAVPFPRDQEPGIVQVQIPFRTRRDRDPHNYCGTVVKAVIDGLVRAGLWPNDTPKYVGHREPVLYKGNLVIVEITPMQPLEEQ